MKRTIRQWRVVRGDSTLRVAQVLGASLTEVHQLEQGSTRLSVVHLRQLAEHFGVSQDAIDHEPHEPTFPGAQITDAMTGVAGSA